MQLKIDSEFKGLIPPLTEEEYQQLEKNIIADGCRDSLIVWGGIIIDGHNRHEICTKHGIEFSVSEKELANREAAKEWIILNQFGRRNLPLYERARLALKLKPIFQEKAKVKQIESGGAVPQKSAKPPIDTRQEIAKVAGVSHDTIHKVEKIEKMATPEQKREIQSGKVSINQAYQQIVRQDREELREQKRQENAVKVAQAKSVEEISGLFQAIVIDPPWDWGDEGDINQFGRGKPDYATMPIEDLIKLPVNKMADDNCHLYLWVTNRSLPKAFKLIEAWGFRYITCITWVKPSFGMGNYFRGSTEQLLFAVKGSQPLKRKDVGTHFTATRGNGHSSKPIEAYELIESCSHGPYLEMFSRNNREGWTMWGEG